MKEVSCRILEMFFRELKKKGLPPDTLIAGVGHSLEHIQNKHERIDWSAFLRFMENAQRIWTDDEFVQIGGAWIDSPFLRHTRVIAGTLFAPKELYRWFDSESKGARKGLGAQMFTCMTTTFRDIGPNAVELDVRLDEGYAPCPAFFLLTKGGYTELPRMVGKPRATVDMRWTDRGARYAIALPPGSERTGLVRRVTTLLKSPAAAARELDDAHAVLQLRYEELETARKKLALQAAQLTTAHSVNELVHANLDLDSTLETIARALVLEAGFVGSCVELRTELEGVEIVRRVAHGENDGTQHLVRTLMRRDATRIGELHVWPTSDHVREQTEDLLDFIEPTISMALDNALSYRAVEDYRRGLEKRVEERTLELTQARDELAETVLSLEQAREARERIFADVNHELRTPLSLILLAVSDARERIGDAGPDELLRSLGAIEHGARRLLRMVDDLLLLAEGREGEIKLWLLPCDLGKAVERVVEAWISAAQTAGISLDLEVESGCVISADRNAIERILTNLLSNALKFTPRGGRVQVSVLAKNGKAFVEVRDTGIGIDEALRKRLFGRFERGARSVNGNVKGSGLGLSLVKELVSGHQGSIEVEGLSGGGTLFRIAIPLDPSAATAARTNDGRPRSSLHPEDFGLATQVDPPREIYDARKSGAATLLLAEDDADLRDRIARLLAEDYRVIAASDGVEALRLAKLHRPDLLVTDISMPGMDGIELTKRFRALAGSRVAPVLLLTAAGGIGDRLSGFEAGAVDYILKPFEPDELRARIRSQLALRSLALQLLESEKLAALGTLSAGLAHEMRNPANGIVNAIEPLRAVLPEGAIVPGSDAAELLDVIASCSEQIGNLSRQLLGFRRGAALEKQTIPLEILLKRVRSTAQPALAGVELRERLDYRGPVRCAEPLIAQVLTNLLDNAAYAAGRGGWVEVRSRIGTDRVIVEFEDSGPGVPTELRERIFEPFFTTKPPGDGNGLGLSTAREIVMQHGGTLGIAEASGRTVFRVELPTEGA